MAAITERPLRQTTGRIRSQFSDLPGLRLTEDQVRRLCNLAKEECRAALDDMERRGELSRDPTGRYRPRTLSP